MTKPRKDTDYLFLSARIRSLEKDLLTSQRLEQLLQSPSVENCSQLLSDLGYAPIRDEASLQSSLKRQREAVFAELERFMPEKQLLDVFRIKYDYHNIKVLLKAPEGAERLLALCANENMERSGVKEGKIELKASCDGLFLLRSESLRAVNAIDELMIATRKGGTAVKKGDKLAGMRVIPLIIAEEKLTAAKAAAGDTPLLELRPWVRKTAAIVATGSEVKKGLIQDTFTPVVKDKLSAYGIETISVSYSGDGVENVAGAISQARQTGAEVILCTGGMSVDPDDNTPGGIRQSGAKIVTYGAPVLPGAMFLLGYYDDGTPVMGLPGCVMYAGATIFDLVLPWVAADVSVTKEWIVSLGEGGLCLGCQPCRWPICPFGK